MQMAGIISRADPVLHQSQLAIGPSFGATPGLVAPSPGVGSRSLCYHRHALRRHLWFQRQLGLSIFCLVDPVLVFSATLVLDHRHRAGDRLHLFALLASVRQSVAFGEMGLYQQSLLARLRPIFPKRYRAALFR